MAKSINRLTDRRVAQYNEPGRYADGNGLFLQVITRTNKSWLLRYANPAAPLVEDKNGKKRKNGKGKLVKRKRRKERWMGLGPVHTFNVAEARERAREARQLIANGKDPIETRRIERDKQQEEQRSNITFKVAAEEFLALHEPTWRNSKHRQQWRNTLKDYAYGKLGTRPVKAIDAALINETVSPIWHRTPETASRVKQRIERIVTWVQDGKPLPTANGARRETHHRALPWQEIPAFMAELRQRDSVSARALEFLVLTAGRTGEVIGCKWSEIDRKVWTIPAERMKAGKEHKVPLAGRAMEILDGLPREKGNDFVFVGGKPGQGLSNMAMLELLRGMRPDDGLTVHGFRSVFSDWAHEQTAHANHVIEMAWRTPSRTRLRRPTGAAICWPSGRS